MQKHYTLTALLLFVGVMVYGQNYCNYDTATPIDMGPGSTTDDATDIITLDDGWMVGLGTSYYISSNSFKTSLVRFDINQNLDPSFGINGRISHNWLQRSTGVCIDKTTDGKLIVGGYQAPSNGASSARGYVARLNSDGSADETFGTEGSLLMNLSSNRSETIGIDAREDGTIRTIMHSESPRGFFMTQVTSDGELDTNFNSIGYNFAGVPSLGYTQGEGDVIFTPDSGAIVIDLASVPNQGKNLLIFKFDKYGEADTLFNGNGLIVIDELVSYHGMSGVIDDEGNLFVLVSNSGNPRAYILYKFDSVTGETDVSFGVNGRLASTEQSQWHFAHGLIIEPSTGNLIALGVGANGGQSQCTIWTVDGDTGTELMNCGNAEMWDFYTQYNQGYRAATIDPVGNIQFWGNGGGTDSTSGVEQGGNFIVPGIYNPNSVNEFDQLEFNLYPNPATDHIVVAGLDYGLHRYSIIDMRGILVESGIYRNGISVNELPQGIYHLQIITQDGLMGVQSFLKE